MEEQLSTCFEDFSQGLGDESGSQSGEIREEAGAGEAAPAPAPETYTLKVNKALREVSREELIALAQKGADYDRVKAAAEQGKSDNMALKNRLADLERPNAALKGLDEMTRRAHREVEEFQRLFPGKQLDDSLVQALMEDVQGGMSLTQAYHNYTLAQKDAQIRELSAWRQAAEQNAANAAGAPGSVSDSGLRRVKTDFDTFLEAFGR